MQLNITSAWESQLPAEENKIIPNIQVATQHENNVNQNHMVGTEEDHFFLGSETVTGVQQNVMSST